MDYYGIMSEVYEQKEGGLDKCEKCIYTKINQYIRNNYANFDDVINFVYGKRHK